MSENGPKPAAAVWLRAKRQTRLTDRGCGAAAAGARTSRRTAVSMAAQRTLAPLALHGRAGFWVKRWKSVFVLRLGALLCRRGFRCGGSSCFDPTSKRIFKARSDVPASRNFWTYFGSVKYTLAAKRLLVGLSMKNRNATLASASCWIHASTRLSCLFLLLIRNQLARLVLAGG